MPARSGDHPLSTAKSSPNAPWSDNPVAPSLDDFATVARAALDELDQGDIVDHRVGVGHAANAGDAAGQGGKPA